MPDQQACGDPHCENIDTNFVLRYFHGMKNVTITVDEEVARWARVWAAKHNTSVSRLVGEMLAERMRQEEDYAAAMRQFLSTKPVPLGKPGAHYPDRDAVHERN